MDLRITNITDFNLIDQGEYFFPQSHPNTNLPQSKLLHFKI